MRISHFRANKNRSIKATVTLGAQLKLNYVLPSKVHLVEWSVQLQVQGKLVPHPGHQELPHLELQQIYVGIL